MSIILGSIDFSMKFRFILIINDPQIDEKHQVSPQIDPFQQLRMKIWTKWPTPFFLNQTASLPSIKYIV